VRFIAADVHVFQPAKLGSSPRRMDDRSLIALAFGLCEAHSCPMSKTISWALPYFLLAIIVWYVFKYILY
jgi:hypothetical protein